LCALKCVLWVKCRRLTLLAATKSIFHGFSKQINGFGSFIKILLTILTVSLHQVEVKFSTKYQRFLAKSSDIAAPYISFMKRLQRLHMIVKMRVQRELIKRLLLCFIIFIFLSAAPRSIFKCFYDGG
jgi:hypothetical protein